VGGVAGKPGHDGSRRDDNETAAGNEIEETLEDDDTFIEEQEEEDADVTDIIGGDIENEEEG